MSLPPFSSSFLAGFVAVRYFSLFFSSSLVTTAISGRQFPRKFHLILKQWNFYRKPIFASPSCSWVSKACHWNLNHHSGRQCPHKSNVFPFGQHSIRFWSCHSIFLSWLKEELISGMHKIQGRFCVFWHVRVPWITPWQDLSNGRT